MENFVVLARKYRPQNFDEVVGQSHITTTLKNSIKNNRLAHAFLFSGPRGVGKTTCARILAKTINCENRTPDGDACNTCTSCKTFNNGQSLNIYELDAASNNSVDDIRELTEQVRYAPQGGKYKVYIIDEVHMLSQAAFNAFLKTLEEPPEYTIFILATTEKQKILPTILSRCQVFDFKRMSAEETVSHLLEISEKEGFEVEKDALHLIAQKSEGCMRDALSIMDKLISFTKGKLTYQNTITHLNILDYDYFFKVTDTFLDQDPGAALVIYDEILEKGFEGDDFLDGYAAFIRDLLVGKDSRSIKLMEVAEGLKKRYEEFAGKLDSGFLVSALNILNETSIQYKVARNKRLSVEMCLIRLSYLEQAVKLISDPGVGTVSKKKVTDKRSAVPLRGPVFVRKDPSGKKGAEIRVTVKSTVKEGEVSYSPKKEGIVAAGEGEKGEKQEEIRKVEASPKKLPPKSATTVLSPVPNDILDLNTIRKKLKERKEKEGSQEEDLEVLSLNMKELKEIWDDQIAGLREDEKQQAANILSLAELQIVDEDEVEIICRNPVQKSFIDDWKMPYAESLKKHFHHPSLKVSVRINNAHRDTGKREVLTNRQKLEKMMEEYPLIRDLKEKLNLDLG